MRWNTRRLIHQAAVAVEKEGKHLNPEKRMRGTFSVDDALIPISG
jgi:hypothetical protein